MSGLPSANDLGTSTVGQSKDDIEDFFASDDKPDVKEPKVDKEDKEDVKDEEVVEDDKDEIELVEDEEVKEDEILDLKSDKIDIDAPPRKKEILAKYPEVFKDFPFLEKILYRDKQYTELFGSFDDAKEAVEKVGALENFESQLSSGNTEEILKSVKEEDPKAFDKIVDNYLVTLSKVDKDAYFEVVGNVGKRFIAELVNEAKNNSNEDSANELRQAALILNQFLFGKSEYEPIKPRSVAENKDDKLEQERLQYIQERFDTARTDLQSRVDNILKSTIDANIDRGNVMTPYVKKQAIRETLELLNKNLGNDASLARVLDKLWRASHGEKFSRSSLDKIQSAYLGRAKGLLPTVIKKIRQEALKDTSSRSTRREDKEDREERPARSGNIPAGRPSRQSKSGEMERGESVLDYFNRD